VLHLIIELAPVLLSIIGLIDALPNGPKNKNQDKQFSPNLLDFAISDEST
jgi:hypothetical protein